MLDGSLVLFFVRLPFLRTHLSCVRVASSARLLEYAICLLVCYVYYGFTNSGLVFIGMCLALIFSRAIKTRFIWNVILSIARISKSTQWRMCHGWLGGA